MPQRTEIVETIRKHSSFLAHVHLSPDPDTIGSVLALKLGLESQGKVVHLFCEDPLINPAHFLPSFDEIKKITQANALTFPHDAYLCLDTAKWELASRNHAREFRKPVIVIDHHPDNNIYTKLKWLEPKSSCTAIIIYKLLKKLGVTINAEIATCLLFGLLGDTGLFQNTNVSGKDFLFANRLLRRGADYHLTMLNLSRSLEVNDLKTWGKALGNLKLSVDGSYAWMTVDFEEAAGLPIPPSTGLLANQYAGRVAGTEFGAVLIEKERNKTTGSLRSRLPEFDVSAIAHRLGGGGHKNAASFKLELPLAKAEQKFIETVAYIKGK